MINKIFSSHYWDSAKQVNGEYLQRLNPGKDKGFLLRSYYEKKRRYMKWFIFIVLFLSIALFLSDSINGKISKDGEVNRGDYFQSDQTIPVLVKSSQYEDLQIDMTVTHQKYTEAEIKKGFREAKDWLPEAMKGENPSFKEVRSNLNFPSVYPSMKINISYVSDNYKIIDGMGQVHNEELEQEETVRITVNLAYEKFNDSVTYEITVCPPIYSEKEQFARDVQTALENADKKQDTKKILKLPTNINGNPVTIQDQGSRRFLYILLAGFLATICLYFGMDDDLRKKYEKRKEALLFDYPDFVSKLALLIGAGMSLTGAIRRIYQDMQAKSGPLYEELTIFVHCLDNGILEERALEDFGRRTGLSRYRKFCGLLCVNVKKGSMNLKTISYLKEFENQINTVHDQGFLTRDIEKERLSYQNIIDNYPLPKKKVSSDKWEEVTLNNPADAVNHSRGILAVVLPEDAELSTVGIQRENYISGRNCNKGSGLAGRRALNPEDEMIFNEYILKKAGNYVTKKHNSELQYQLEYVLHGRSSDIENLKETVKNLLLLRETANYTYLLLDGAKSGEAEALAGVVALACYCPELKDPIKQTILFAWAYAESVYDVRSLLEGGKVPFIKSSETWHYSLADMFGFATDTGQANETIGTGLSYTDYLRIFLTMEKKEDKTWRFMDVVEMDIRKTAGNRSFRLDTCVDYLEAEAFISGGYADNYQIIRSYYYEK